MTRDEAIEAGAKAIYQATWINADDCRAESAAVLDAIGWRDERAVKAEALREAVLSKPSGTWLVDYILTRADRIERGDA